MSNINQVIALVKATPNYDKAQMIEQIVKTLKVTKSNAQVYLYNANKKLGNPTSTKKAKQVTLAPVKSTKAFNKDFKEKNLATMKEVTRTKKREVEEAEREAAKAEAMQSIDDYMENDVKPYIE